MASSKARRAVIYARLSIDRTGAGLSVDDQAQQCRELAARHGFTVTEPVRSDNDLTAFTGSNRHRVRKGYQALLDDLRTGRANAVIAWHTDRLHRDMTELEEYINVCGEGSDGVPTYTVKGGEVHLDTASGRMVARILGAVARQEVEHMVERQKNAKRRIRDSGLWSGGKRPFGFTVVEMYDEHGAPVMTSRGTIRHTIAENPAEAAELRSMYDRVLAGVSLYTVAKDLNDRGVPTAQRSARGWDGKMIRSILNRGSNAGLVEHGQYGGYPGEIIGKGKWPAIVSEDKVLAARAMLSDPARNSPGPRPGPKATHLLSGIAICGECGSRRMRVIKNMSGGRGYSCADCWGVFRDVRRTDLMVVKAIITMLGKPDLAATLSPKVDVTALTARRIWLRRRADDLGDAFGRGEIDMQMMTAGSKPILEELAEVERKIGDAYQGTGLEDVAGAADPVAKWAGLDTERKRALIRKLLDVTILSIRNGKTPGVTMGVSKGEQPGGMWFHEESVRIEPRQPA